MRLATGYQPCALGDGILDVLADLGGGAIVDQRANVSALLQAVANPQLGHRRLEFLGKGVVNAVLHVDAVDAHTGLPGVAVLGLHGALHRLVQVGVIEDDKWRVAAQLQGHLLDPRRALLHQLGAHFGGAGEGNLADLGVGGQLVADVAGRAGHDAEHALGNSGALGQLDHRQRRERRLRCRLDDHGAASRQRRAGLAGDHRRRKIPRGDRRGHADRLLDDEDALVLLVTGDGVAVDALGFLGEPLDKGGRIGDLALGFGQRLALLQRHQSAQVVLVLHQQLEPATQLLRTLLGGQITPGRQRPLGGVDGAAGFGSAHLRHRTENLAGGRVVHADGLATVSIQPGAIDIGLLAEQRGVFELHGSLLGHRSGRPAAESLANATII